MTGSASVPLKAYRSRLRGRDLVIYSLAFWPAVALAAWLANTPVGAAGFLADAVFVLPIFFLLGRPATIVLPEGIRVVPYAWPGKTYDWPSISEVVVDVAGHGRHQQNIHNVRLVLTDGRRVWLRSIGDKWRAVVDIQALRPGRAPGLPPSAPSPGPRVNSGPKPRAHPRWNVVIALVLVTLGILVTAGGIKGSVDQTDLAKNGRMTIATVTYKGDRHCYKGGCTCPLRWIFTDATGATYTGTSEDCMSLYTELEPGDDVPIVFDPARPTLNQLANKPRDPAAPTAGAGLVAYLLVGLSVPLLAEVAANRRPAPHNLSSTVAGL